MRNHGIERFVGDIKTPCIAHNELDLLTDAFGSTKALRNLHEASAEVDASDSTSESSAPSDCSRCHAGAAPYVEYGTGHVDIHSVEILCEHGMKAEMLTSRFEPRSKDFDRRIVQLVGYCININGRHARLLGSSNGICYMTRAIQSPFGVSVLVPDG
jgi:hypothetical protein